MWAMRPKIVRGDVHSSRPRARPAAQGAAAGIKKKMHDKTAWHGPCCGGSHYWGHGAGHDAKAGGRWYRCSKCKKSVTKLTPEQTRAREKELAEAKVLETTGVTMEELMKECEEDESQMKPV